ncbi:MAG: efflux RND transporter periplasmic adaptor subunit [Chitinophagaceae bacterium]|nr:efflux RND transporter periplasmic adaptor subunit [Chitinophagaceae bacterium]
MKNILIICSCFFLLSCKDTKTENNNVDTNSIENIVTLTDAQLKNAGIELGKITSKSISSILKVNGKIDVPPQNIVSISVPLGGYLKSSKLLQGMHVNKGEILGVMEDQQYIQLQQDYLTAKAQFNFIESEYNRQKELNIGKATSDKIFEQTKSNYQTQLILIKSLEEKLRLIGLNPNKIDVNHISRSINIYSPINGFVSAVNVNIGKYVNPADVLFELVNPTDIHLALNIFEKDVDKLFIGQKLIAYNNNKPNKKYQCDIILISKNLNKERSAEVHCHFDQYDKSLLPGMFMNAEIEIQSNKHNVLPSDAIVRYQNQQYVFISQPNNQFEMVPIETLDSEHGYTAIEIDEKYVRDNFVIKGAYTLLMKMKNTEEEE